MSKPKATAPHILQIDEYSEIKQASGDHRISYGTHSSQFGDLYLPPTHSGKSDVSNTKYPVVVLLHGGCWKAHRSLDLLGNLARALSQHAVAVWNLEYRRLGNGGGFPETFWDVQVGVQKLNDLATMYPLDLNNVVLVGHSAGGHLALWLAGSLPQLRDDFPKLNPSTSNADDERLDKMHIQSVIGLAPVCDLERAVAWGICGSCTTSLVGGAPKDVWENYQLASPASTLPLNIRYRFIQGSLDKAVPLEYVRPFVQVAQKLGDDAELIVVPNAGHYEIVMPSQDAGKTTIKTILIELKIAL